MISGRNAIGGATHQTTFELCRLPATISATIGDGAAFLVTLFLLPEVLEVTKALSACLVADRRFQRIAAATAAAKRGRPSPIPIPSPSFSIVLEVCSISGGEDPGSGNGAGDGLRDRGSGMLPSGSDVCSNDLTIFSRVVSIKKASVVVLPTASD